jgi:hypothetical protein
VDNDRGDREQQGRSQADCQLKHKDSAFGGTYLPHLRKPRPHLRHPCKSGFLQNL